MNSQKKKLWTDIKIRTHKNYELTKDTPYLALTGELWGVLSEFFGEKIPRDIESALYSFLAVSCSVDKSESRLNIRYFV